MNAAQKDEKDEERERLERDAAWVEERLARTLEGLGQKKDEALETVEGTAETADRWVPPVGVGLAVVGALIWWRSRTHEREHSLGERWAAVVRAWRYPTRVANSPRRSVAARFVEAAAAGVVVHLAAKFATRSLPALH